jgi:hypothetical protein
VQAGASAARAKPLQRIPPPNASAARTFGRRSYFIESHQDSDGLAREGDKTVQDKTMQDVSVTPVSKIAEFLGGEVSGGQVLAPGPGHSPEDRSLSVKLDSKAPDGFLVHSFAGDDPIVCRDHVRAKLGLSTSKPKKTAAGTNKPWSPIIARYVTGRRIIRPTCKSVGRRPKRSSRTIGTARCG